MCVTFVVFTDCERCTRPISTNPLSMEAGEYGLTRGTCLFVRRLEGVAVAGLLWLSWCVVGGEDFFGFFFSIFFSFRSTQPAASMRPPLASFTSLLIISRSVWVCMRNILRDFYRLRELYGADFHNPESVEAGEHGLTRGTCFFPRRLEVVAVAGLMSISWRVFGGAGFFCVCFFSFFFVFERTRPAASMRPPLASFSSLLVPGCVQGAII